MEQCKNAKLNKILNYLAHLITNPILTGRLVIVATKAAQGISPSDQLGLSYIRPKSVIS